MYKNNLNYLFDAARAYSHSFWGVARGPWLYFPGLEGVLGQVVFLLLGMALEHRVCLAALVTPPPNMRKTALYLDFCAFPDVLHREAVLMCIWEEISAALVLLW